MMFRKDQKGFSLIEMIIAIGVIAILSDLSINLLNHIFVANTEKAEKYISAAMSKVQVNAMKKSASEKPYLYLYSVGDTYYYIISQKDSFDSDSMNASSGMELGSGIKIYQNAVSDGNLVTSGNPMRISYKKDGSFLDDVPETFYLVGSYKTCFTLNKKTGKHFVAKE